MRPSSLTGGLYQIAERADFVSPLIQCQLGLCSLEGGESDLTEESSFLVLEFESYNNKECQAAIEARSQLF